MKILLVGFGVVGRAVATLLEQQRVALYRSHGLSPSIVGVIDSKVAAGTRGASTPPRSWKPRKSMEPSPRSRPTESPA